MDTLPWYISDISAKLGLYLQAVEKELSMAQIGKGKKLGTLIAKGRVQNRAERAKTSSSAKREQAKASGSIAGRSRKPVYDLRQQATQRTRDIRIPERD